MAENTKQEKPEPTEDEKALQTALAEQAADRPAIKDIVGVRYLHGQTDQRVLTVADQNAIGNDNAADSVVWNKDNNWFVSKNQFNAAALDWFAANPNFSIE